MAVTAPETDTPPAVADAEAAGRVLARFVAALESERYTGGDSIALVRLFTTVERTASAGKTLAARRVEEANLHRLTGHRSAAELLASSTGDSVGDTKGLLRLGHQLAHRPELDEAFRAGRLSRRRATQVAEAAGVNPTREHDLVDGAQVDTDATFKERCLRAQAEGRSRQDEARHHRHLHDQRSARTWTDGDGALCLHARLAPGPGAELQAALEAQADRQFGRARHERALRDPRRLPGRRPGGPGQRAGDPRSGTRDHRPSGPAPRPPGAPPTPGPRSRWWSTSSPCVGGTWCVGGAVRSPGWARCPSTTPGTGWVTPWSSSWWPTAPTSPRSTRPGATSPAGCARPCCCGTRGAWSRAVTPGWASRTTTGSPTSPGAG